MRTSLQELPTLTFSGHLRSVLAVCCLLPSLVLPQTSTQTPSRQADIRAFLEEEVTFDKYLFSPGRFPEVRWANPERVERLMGEIPLTVEYYDRSFKRVQRAEKEGRYGAVVRGRTVDGESVVRYATLYCTNADLDDYSPDVPVAIRPLTSFGISPDQWKAYERNLRRYSFGSLLLYPKYDRDAAVFLAGMSELDTAASSVLTPRVRDRLWWTRLKRGAETPTPSVTPRISASRPESKPVGLAELNTADKERVRSICAEWTMRSGVPMTLFISQKGNVLFHEAFSPETGSETTTTETRTWMASITKLVTGVLVMQFVDRGLVDLDVPIDRYLPELRRSQPCPITLRHLLTHTSGLSWTGEWASDWEHSMENRVAMALPMLTPGTTFSYHRSGYALTSKILERISGETVPQLFQRMIFDPLGMSSAFSENTYGGLYATSSDLGRVGQMLLNRGTFGLAEILSEKAFAAMLPRPLPLSAAKRTVSWGIGTTLLGGNGLSNATFGHEAASGAVFRIDPENELVLVVARDRVGPSYDEYERYVRRLIETVTSGMAKPETPHE